MVSIFLSGTRRGGNNKKKKSIRIAYKQLTGQTDDDDDNDDDGFPNETGVSRNSTMTALSTSWKEQAVVPCRALRKWQWHHDRLSSVLFTQLLVAWDTFTVSKETDLKILLLCFSPVDSDLAYYFQKFSKSFFVVVVFVCLFVLSVVRLTSSSEFYSKSLWDFS